MSSLPAFALRRADSSSPWRRSVRRTACSAESGSGSLTRSACAVVGHEAPRVGLEPAGADENVLHDATEPLLAREAAEHRAALRERRRYLVEPEAPDLLDEIDVARHVPRTPARHGHRQVVRDLELEPLKCLALLVDRRLEPDERVDALRPEPDDRPFRQLALHVGRAGPARTGQLDEQLRRVDRRLLGQLGVDALLPAGRRLRAEPQPAGAAQDRQRIEVRGLEQDVRRLGGDLAVRSAHDPRDRDRALGVGDHQVGRLELPQRAVERGQLLARRRPADDDPPARQLGRVEGVHHCFYLLYPFIWRPSITI